MVTAQGFPDRVPRQVVAYANASEDFSPRGKRCLGAGVAAIARQQCTIGVSTNEPTFLVWGDSHAAAIVPAFRIAADRQHQGGAFIGFNSCSPLLGVSYPNVTAVDEERCGETNREAADFVRNSKSIATIFLVANWPAYLGEEEKFRRGLANTVKFLRSQERHVVIIGGLPRPGFDVPRAFALAEQYGRPQPELPRPTIDQLERLIKEVGINADYISITPALCGASNCPLEIPGGLLFSDGNHLSATAARLLVGPYLAETVELANEPQPIVDDSIGRQHVSLGSASGADRR